LTDLCLKTTTERGDFVAMTTSIQPIGVGTIPSGSPRSEPTYEPPQVTTTPPPESKRVVGDARPDTDLEGRPLEEFPPSYVFAPGFLNADRRGIVAYPGMRLADDMIAAGMVRDFAPERAREMLMAKVMGSGSQSESVAADRPTLDA
jgi:hypothetical protein